jgi:acetylornithine aminotransferase
MKNDLIPFYDPSNSILQKAEDCYLFDTEGNRYIDFESGVWCENLGHNHPVLNERIKRQLSELTHHGYFFRNEFSEKLSVKLQELIGFKNGSSVFLSSGSEAVNLSITLARCLTGKKKLLKIDHSYLSAFGFGQISDHNNAIINIPFNDTGAISEIDFSEIAAFVIETGGASNGVVRFPGKAFMDQLTGVCQKNQCLLIAEEVTTGIGRSGKWFGFNHYDFSPDMVVCGKALGNGFPVSSLTLSSSLTRKFEEQPFRYAQSHQNDPLGCVAALTVIEIIENENLIAKGNATGAAFIEKLHQLKNSYPGLIKDCRGRGLMLALEFNDSFDGLSVHRQLFDLGFVCGFKSNTLRFMPPLTISESDIDSLTTAIGSCLK